MVHKSSIIPGLSQFIDNSILSHYPPTSMKRILSAGAIALYLKQNSNIVDQLLNNPVIGALGIYNENGMIDIESLRDVYKNEISKVGFMRIHFPVLGDVDFNSDDIDALYKYIMNADTTSPKQSTINTIQGGI